MKARKAAQSGSLSQHESLQIDEPLHQENEQIRRTHVTPIPQPRAASLSVEITLRCVCIKQATPLVVVQALLDDVKQKHE